MQEFPYTSSKIVVLAKKKEERTKIDCRKINLQKWKIKFNRAEFDSEIRFSKLNGASYKTNSTLNGSMACCLGACSFSCSVKYQNYTVTFSLFFINRSFANQSELTVQKKLL